MLTTTIAKLESWIRSGSGLKPRNETTTAVQLSTMTTAQRDALTPVAGMMIYNSSAGFFQKYEGSAWGNFGREILQANRTYYVRADGSNSNTGLVNTAGGAFLTIQKAVDTAAALDSSIYNVTIKIGTSGSTFAENLVLRTMVGSGSITIQGYDTTTSNTIFSTTGSAGAFGIYGASVQTIYYLKDFKMVGGTGATCAIGADMGTNIHFTNLNFGAGWSARHLYVLRNALVTADGPYEISGSCVYHATTSTGMINIPARAVTLTGTPAFTAFANFTYLGSIIWYQGSFTGTCTGKRYEGVMNAVCFTIGGGANYFPGDAAGTTATGAQYS